jgi:hypothetical protein
MSAVLYDGDAGAADPPLLMPYSPVRVTPDYGFFPLPRRIGSGGISGVVTGNGGGGFDLRFNLSRNTRCAFRLGEPPLTLGSSI